MAVISVFSATQLSKPNSEEVSVFSLGFACAGRDPNWSTPQVI